MRIATSLPEEVVISKLRLGMVHERVLLAQVSDRALEGSD